MIKLFRYECKRLLLNKFFLGLLVITSLYCWQILSGDIVCGIGSTAPFSEWSYGYYLASILPLLLITLLFFITFLFSAKEKKVSVITSATPLSSVKYGSIRYLAILICFCMIVAMAVIISLIFYQKTFQFDQFTSFVKPFLWTVLPAFLLFMGLGILLGNINVGLVYGLMTVALICSFLPFPATLDLVGRIYYSAIPSTLPLGPNGDPAFIIPTAIKIGKLIMSGIGITTVGIGLSFYHRK